MVHRAFADAGKDILFVVGQPGHSRAEGFRYSILQWDKGAKRERSYLFAACSKCKAIALAPRAWLSKDSDDDDYILMCGCGCINRKTTSFGTDMLLDAYHYAQSYRFNEKPPFPLP